MQNEEKKSLFTRKNIFEFSQLKSKHEITYLMHWKD